MDFVYSSMDFLLTMFITGRFSININYSNGFESNECSTFYESRKSLIQVWRGILKIFKWFFHVEPKIEIVNITNFVSNFTSVGNLYTIYIFTWGPKIEMTCSATTSELNWISNGNFKNEQRPQFWNCIRTREEEEEELDTSFATPCISRVSRQTTAGLSNRMLNTDLIWFDLICSNGYPFFGKFSSKYHSI